MVSVTSRFRVTCGRMAWRAAGCAAALLLAASCVVGPTVSLSTDTPALALVPVREAGIADRRARFRAILCAVTARDGLPADRGCERALWHLADEPVADGRVVALPPARLPLRVLIDPGLGADCLAGIARPFEDALDAVRAQGYAIEVLPLGNLAGSAENAGRLGDAVLAQPEDGRALLVLGYSRGATDGLEALATLPDARARVAAFIAMAGTVNGSPLADHVTPALADLGRFLPGARCDAGDGQGVAELRPSFRLARRAALPPIPGVPLYSLVTFVDRAEVSPILRPTWDILARVDARNDGQMLAWDQILPGSALLGFLRADHLSAIAPVGPQLPWYVRDLLHGEDFPRAAVLEAVVRLVEEDLLAGAAALSSPPGQ